MHAAPQALTPGGTVSQHLVTRAPCPTLVLPYRALGLGDPSRGDFSPDQVASPRDSLGVGSGRGDDEGLHALTHARAQLQTSAPVQTGALPLRLPCPLQPRKPCSPELLAARTCTASLARSRKEESDREFYIRRGQC